MKMEYQFLVDVVAKSLLEKVGSFDVFTNEKFMVMADFVAKIKIN